MMIVDPPSPLSPAEVWEDFLDEMESLQAKGRDVRIYIDEARRILRDKASGALP